MTQFNLVHGIQQTLILMAISSVLMQEITYHLVEENRKDIVLGNLNHFIKSKLKTDEKNVEFLISSKFFGIDNLSKNVICKETIDLDTICNRESVCCNEDVCIISTKVVIQQNKQYSGTFLLKVEVKDVNDNTPLFLESQQIIRVSEHIPINTSISIDHAIDKDFSKVYSQKNYELIDETSTFKLNIQQLSPDNLAITVVERLDYEFKRSYTCHLRACDAIFQNCVRKTILIEVLDENDNSPVFLLKRYRKRVKEDFKVGREILKVHAVDIDGERYNKTIYGFVSRHDLKDVFSLDANLGTITLQKKLSSNAKDKYNFRVYAIDSLSVDHKKDFADVEIEVEDVNDHEPVIALIEGHMPDSYTVFIEENSNPKALFSIQISDQDKGDNGKVNCSLEVQSPGALKLKWIDSDVYQVQTLVPFDFESIQVILAQIVCNDKGEPRLVSRKAFRVVIKDVNEFSPEFKQNKVELYLNENLVEDKTILSVEVQDKDKGAVLSYRLDDIGGIYFRINAKTGEIKTSKENLDRETREKIIFKVFVTDSIESPKTATATVTVFIIDQNDNSPKFTNAHPFMIAENQYIYTKLSTKVEATDSDVDENNRSILFRLIHTYNSKMELVHDRIFDVNSKGELETMSIIDREKDSNFTLTILAQDKGKPSLSTITNITITIIDINDNSPVWIYPDSRNSYEPEAVVNVTKNVDSGTVLSVLKAIDIDAEDAGRVGYLLLSTDRYSGENSFFRLNKSSGAVIVSQTPLLYGSSQLRVRAHDYGQPQLYRDATVIINVIHSSDTVFSSLNMVIIIGMLAITATISIFLIVAIIFIRRSPNPPANLPCRSRIDEKYHGNHLEISCPNVFDKLAEKEPVFIDSTSQHHHWGLSEVTTNLTMYPQSSSDGGCTTYVRFATPNTFGHDLDGESADSGKGTSDLEMNLQSTLKGASMNPYNNIQIIPSSRTGYAAPNNYMRRSYQIINDAEKYGSLNYPMLQQFAKQQSILSSVQGPTMESQTSSYQEIPFNTLPPYRS